MKLYKIIIVLVLAAIAYANKIDIFKLLKRDVQFDSEELNNSLSEECKEEQKKSEYLECMILMNMNNFNQVCKNFKSEKCQNFYNNPLDYFPICKEFSKFSEIFQPTIMKTYKLTLELECQTDENNNLCPLAIATIKQNGVNAAVEDTCKSKICTETAIKIYKDFNIDQFSANENLSTTTGSYTYEELSGFNKIIAKLESNECKSQYATSNATTTKFSTCLIILIALYLYQLLY